MERGWGGEKAVVRSCHEDIVTQHYSYASLERIPRDWAKFCLIVKMPYCQYKKSFMRLKVVSLIGGHALLTSAL